MPITLTFTGELGDDCNQRTSGCKDDLICDDAYFYTSTCQEASNETHTYLDLLFQTDDGYGEFEIIVEIGKKIQSTPANPELYGIRTNDVVPLSRTQCILFRSIRTPHCPDGFLRFLQSSDWPKLTVPCFCKLAITTLSVIRLGVGFCRI